MKYYILLPILAIFIFAGCSKQNSVTGPQSTQSMSKRQWIKLSAPSSLLVENTYSASKSIDGNKGGTVELSQSFQNNGNWALVTAKLTIPKGAFSGTQVISYTVNTETAGIDFSPALNFDKSLSLDLVFTGVDLSGYNNTSDLKFAYLDGNTVVPAAFTYVNANIAQGLLIVIGAQINHFSRYGWSTLDDSGD
jgi:hypothetical protein